MAAHQAAVSPLTAVALLLLAVAVVRLAYGGEEIRAFLVATAALAVVPLAYILIEGDDAVSLTVARRLHLSAEDSARMALGTALSVMSITAALWPRIRVRARLPDILCVLALLIAGIALLGYVYGALDIYRMALFRTMSVQSAVAISLLAVAAITLRRQNGLFALVTSRNEAGSATRRQLLMAIAGPLI